MNDEQDPEDLATVIGRGVGARRKVPLPAQFDSVNWM
jgi:hypothetical protein